MKIGTKRGKTRSGIVAQSLILSEAKPTFRQVTEAFTSEAFTGWGTADRFVDQYNIDQQGKLISQEDWEQSDYYDPDVDWYQGMTVNAASILSERKKRERRNAEIIDRASTGQTIGAFAASFPLALFEPANFAVGVATFGAGRVLGSMNTLTSINSAISRLPKYKQLATVGAIEGAVSASALEIASVTGLDTLQEDYHFSNTLLNVGLSVALGAGLQVAPTVISDKINYRQQKKFIEKFETIQAQGQLGQKIDGGLYDLQEQIKTIKKEQENFLDFQRKGLEANDLNAAKIEESILNYMRNEYSQYNDKGQLVDSYALKQAVGEVTESFSGEKFFTEAEIGGAPEVTGFKGNKPQWAIDENVNGEYVSRVYNKLLEGKKLKAKEQRVADALIGRADDILNQDAIELLNILRPLGLDDIDASNNAEILDTLKEIEDYAGRDFNEEIGNLESQLQQKIREQNSYLNDPLVHKEGMDEIDSIVKNEKQAENYNLDTDELIAIEEKIAAMREQGLLDDDTLAMLADLNNVNEENVTKGFRALEICLTRG